jgi:uncharacterized protein YjbI with pentapeptide repeats
MAKQFTKKELKEILSQHKLWLITSGEQGKRANLQGARLQGVDLKGADLQSANIKGTLLELGIS